jgi:hypothetical protein
VDDELTWLFVLALPTACVSWTITREDVFRDSRDWFAERSRTCRRWWQRKLCYVWTCEYCFSHYVAAAFIALTDYHLLLPDWRGLLIAWLALVAVANVYLSVFTRLRVDIRKERAEVETLTRRAG